jgi:hypothetical protein
MGDSHIGVGSVQHDGVVELPDQLIVEGPFFDGSTPTDGAPL